MSSLAAILERRFLGFLTVLFLAALLIRVGFAARFVGLDTPPSESAGGLDVLDYEQFACSMSEGNGYRLADGTVSARRTPGTSLAILPVYAVCGRNYVLAHVWFCTLSALTCVAAAWAAALSFGRIEGALAGVLLAVYPGSFYYAMHFFSEVPFTLWLTLACGLTLWAHQQRSALGAAGAGVSWGLAMLCRPQIALILPMALMLPIFVRSLRCRAWFKNLAIQAVFVGLVLSPWLLRNYLQFGRATMCNVVGGVTFFGSNNEYVATHPDLAGSWQFGPEVTGTVSWPATLTEVELGDVSWEYGKQFVRDHLAEMPRLTLAKLWRLISPFKETNNRVVRWAFAISWMAVVPWLVVGLISRWRSQREAVAFLCLPLVATVVSTVIFYGDIRLRDAVAPVFLTFTAVGLVDVARRFFVASVET